MVAGPSASWHNPVDFLFISLVPLGYNLEAFRGEVRSVDMNVESAFSIYCGPGGFESFTNFLNLFKTFDPAQNWADCFPASILAGSGDRLVVDYFPMGHGLVSIMR